MIEQAKINTEKGANELERANKHHKNSFFFYRVFNLVWK